MHKSPCASLIICCVASDIPYPRPVVRKFPCASHVLANRRLLLLRLPTALECDFWRRSWSRESFEQYSISVLRNKTVRHLRQVPRVQILVTTTLLLRQTRAHQRTPCRQGPQSEERGAEGTETESEEQNHYFLICFIILLCQLCSRTRKTPPENSDAQPSRSRSPPSLPSQNAMSSPRSL